MAEFYTLLCVYCFAGTSSLAQGLLLCKNALEAVFLTRYTLSVD